MNNQYLTKQQKYDVTMSAVYHILNHCLLLSSHNIMRCIKALDKTHMIHLSNICIIFQFARDIVERIEQEQHYNSMYSITDRDMRNYAKEHNMQITVFPH